jgi:hypothetical protein
MCAVPYAYNISVQTSLPYFNSGFAPVHEELTNPNHVHGQSRLSANLAGFHELLRGFV